VKTLADVIQAYILADDCMSLQEAAALFESEPAPSIPTGTVARLVAGMLASSPREIAGNIQHVVHHFPDGSSVHAVGVADGIKAGDRVG